MKTPTHSLERKKKRTWDTDVFLLLKTLEHNEFTLSEVYLFEDVLKHRHPGQTDTKSGIRFTLQQLRDRGIIEFVGSGKYKKINLPFCW